MEHFQQSETQIAAVIGLFPSGYSDPSDPRKRRRRRRDIPEGIGEGYSMRY